MAVPTSPNANASTSNDAHKPLGPSPELIRSLSVKRGRGYSTSGAATGSSVEDRRRPSLGGAHASPRTSPTVRAGFEVGALNGRAAALFGPVAGGGGDAGPGASAGNTAFGPPALQRAQTSMAAIVSQQSQSQPQAQPAPAPQLPQVQSPQLQPPPSAGSLEVRHVPARNGWHKYSSSGSDPFGARLSPAPGAAPAQQRVTTTTTLDREKTHTPSLSASKASEQDLRSVGEFAQEHLFSQFRQQANDKLSQYTGSMYQSVEIQIDESYGQGADAKFDQLLRAIGHSASRNPSSFIDKVTLWHQDVMRNDFGAQDASDRHAQVRDRKTSLAIYLLCRALQEILRQTSSHPLARAELDRLEELIYLHHFRHMCREVVERTRAAQAKWDMLVVIIGALFDLDFDKMSARVLADLQTFHNVLGVKGTNDRDTEAEAAQFLRGLRSIPIKCDTEAGWAKSVRFLQSIAEKVCDAHGQVAKEAYCRFLGAVLLPVAASRRDFMQLSWRKVVQTLIDKLAQLASKPKYWHAAFPVHAILACIAPEDLFAARFQSAIAGLPARLRERHHRATALKSICRMVWVYLEKTGDALAAADAAGKDQEPIVKDAETTLRDIVRAVFFSGKRYSLSKEPSIAEPLVQLIRIIGARHQLLFFRNILFPLINYDLFSSAKDWRDLRPEQLDADKSVIAIRAFMAVLGDLEERVQPKFPLRFDDERRDDGALSPDRQRSSQQFLHQRKRSEQAARATSTASLFDAPSRDFYLHFCEVITRIVLICDARFGGGADDRHDRHDRYAAPPLPKTPMSTGFPRRDDTALAADERHAFWELLEAGIYGLPRCLNSRVPPSDVLRLLCHATAHVHEKVAFGAMFALKAVARQGHAQVVVDRFSGFVLNYDTRNAGTNAASLGPNHLEHILTLYMELLNIWIAALNDRSKAAAAVHPLADDKAQFDASSTWAQVDRVESQALFFLCSPLYRVRTSAVKILALVASLDKALGTTNTRVISVLENNSAQILKVDDEELTFYERMVLERDLSTVQPQSALITLCCSYHDDQRQLWYKVFPRFLEAAFQACPVAVTQTREDICARLAQMQPLLEGLDERLRMQQQPLHPSIDAVSRARLAPGLTDSLVDQWKAYLIFACKTLTKAGTRVAPAAAAPDPTHIRKSSKSSHGAQDAFTTGVDMFQKAVPFLFASSHSLRNATVVGLGSIALPLLRPLLECLEAYSRGADDAGAGAGARLGQARAPASPRSRQRDFSVEVAHVHKIVSQFLQRDVARHDDWIMGYFSAYTKDLSMYLHAVDAGAGPDHSRLRFHFCGLIERFYAAAARSERPEKYMSFQTRRSAFTNMEVWTGLMAGDDAGELESMHGHQHQHGHHDSRVAKKAHALKAQKELRIAALSSMAALCAGPVQMQTSASMQKFDQRRLMQWVHRMFNDDSDTVNTIGRTALTNIVSHNPQHPLPLNAAVDQFYHAETTKCLESYLSVVSHILTLQKFQSAMELSKLLTALLFTLTHTESRIRTLSARLLRSIDEGQESRGTCRLQDFDMSIADRTPAVYKKAHFDMSSRLADAFPEESVGVFAEFSQHFLELGDKDRSEDQRSLVHAILPWLKKIDLQLQRPDGDPTPSTYMILMNLLEITLGYSAPLQHEIQALWQTLVVGHHRGNVRLILDFAMELTLDRRNAGLVEVVRQIVVFLSDTLAGERVIDALLQHIVPAKMQNDDQNRAARIATPREAMQMFPHVGKVPHGLADSQQPWDMTLGQLSLILLVDLIVAPRKIPTASIPPVLQAVLVLWDHKIPIVQEQAREMLVHLIHELVISEINKDGPVPSHVEHFIDLLRRRDQQVLWSYNENERADKGFELSKPFTYVVSELIHIFEIKYPDIGIAWGRVTLDWATTCRALHIALRSLQIYRCIITPLNKNTVSGLVRVLAGIIADEEPERRSYAIEAIRTIRAVLVKVDAADAGILSQLFWVVSSCLGVGQEAEFAEALPILTILLDKLDLSNAAVCSALLDSKPENMHWPAGGLTQLVLAGCRSSAQIDQALLLLQRLIVLPSTGLVGSADRILYVLLANLPHMARYLREPGAAPPADVLASARTLAQVAAGMGLADLALLLDNTGSLAQQADAFVLQILRLVKAAFFPAEEFNSLLFVMGMLSNSRPEIQSEALTMLDMLTAEIDMANSEIAVAGPDLVSPLLRLLQTDLCPLALKVLDKFTAIVSRSAARQQQLHMSMANWRSSRQLRRLYDETQSLFGIPDESGWSVAVPGRLKMRTREALLLAANMYSSTAAGLDSSVPTPEVDFLREGVYSYFPDSLPSLTSDEATLADTTMGELVSKLDSLDDFFDEPDSGAGDTEDDDTVGDGREFRHGHGHGHSHAPPAAVRTTPTRYSPQTRFAASPHSGHDSFSTASTHNRSFQSSLSSSHHHSPRSAHSAHSPHGTPSSPPHHHPHLKTPAMTPSSFRASPARAQRPGIHPRSITSPAVNQRTPPDRAFVVPRDSADALSDDDALFSGAASDASSVFDGLYRPMQRTRQSFRAGMRSFKKLAGGHGSHDSGSSTAAVKQKLRLPLALPRAPDGDSPEVPKVPDVYLQNPKSSEL